MGVNYKKRQVAIFRASGWSFWRKLWGVTRAADWGVAAQIGSVFWQHGGGYHAEAMGRQLGVWFDHQKWWISAISPPKYEKIMNMLGNHHQNSGGHSNFWRIRHDMIYSTKNGYAGTGQATRRGFQVPSGEFIRPTYRLVGIHQLQLVAGCNQGTSLHLPNMNMAMSWVILPFFRSEVLVPFELLLVINHYT